MIRSAVISECGKYRHQLRRDWGLRMCPREVLWVMCNPSTADGEKDDPTLESIIRISQHNGFGGLRVVNVYDYRSTDPKALKAAGYPRSPVWLCNMVAALEGTRVTVAAWGNNPRTADALDTLSILRSVRPVYRVRLTQHGEPGHPLYLRADSPLVLHE